MGHGQSSQSPVSLLIFAIYNPRAVAHWTLQVPAAPSSQEVISAAVGQSYGYRCQSIFPRPLAAAATSTATAIMEFNRILVYLTVHALFGQLDEYDSRLIEDTWLMGDITDNQRETLCDLFNRMIYANT